MLSRELLPRISEAIRETKGKPTQFLSDADRARSQISFEAFSASDTFSDPACAPRYGLGTVQVPDESAVHCFMQNHLYLLFLYVRGFDPSHSLGLSSLYCQMHRGESLDLDSPFETTIEAFLQALIHVSQAQAYFFTRSFPFPYSQLIPIENFQLSFNTFAESEFGSYFTFLIRFYEILHSIRDMRCIRVLSRATEATLTLLPSLSLVDELLISNGIHKSVCALPVSSPPMVRGHNTGQELRTFLTSELQLLNGVIQTPPASFLPWITHLMFLQEIGPQKSILASRAAAFLVSGDIVPALVSSIHTHIELTDQIGHDLLLVLQQLPRACFSHCDCSRALQNSLADARLMIQSCEATNFALLNFVHSYHDIVATLLIRSYFSERLLCVRELPLLSWALMESLSMVNSFDQLRVLDGFSQCSEHLQKFLNEASALFYIALTMKALGIISTQTALSSEETLFCDKLLNMNLSFHSYLGQPINATGAKRISPTVVAYGLAKRHLKLIARPNWSETLTFVWQNRKTPETIKIQLNWENGLLPDFEIEQQ